MSKLKSLTPIKRTINNFITNTNYSLESLDESYKISKQDIENIVEVCNEELVYDFLFRKKLNGEPYSDSGAFNFINFACNGWLKDEKYVFIIRNDKGNIVGAIDIKSSKLEQGEIGYWLSKNASGVMTNTILEIVKIAQESEYQSLVAYTLPNNNKSQNAVKRAGFMNEGEVKSERGDYSVLKFVKKLL